MRFRSTLFLLAVALLCAVAPRPLHAAAPGLAATPDSTLLPAPIAVVSDSGAPSLSVASHHAPSTPAPRRQPINPLLAFAVAGATKRRPTRRSRNVPIPDVPLLLDSTVHVMRDGELVIITGGVLVDDTELEDEEIEDLKNRGVVRPASPAEIEAASGLVAAQKAAELTRTHEQQRAALTAKHQADLADAEAKGNLSENARTKLLEKQAAEHAALAEQQAKELEA